MELYTPLVYSCCRRRGLQESDAEDVVQDVLHAVSTAIRKFEYDPERGTFRSWLRTVTQSKLNSFFLRQRRQPQGSGDTRVQQFLEAQPSAEEESEWDREYYQRLFHWAGEKIRQEFQDSTWAAFWQSAVEGRPAQEIAADLGISVNAVYVAKSRVLARPRERMRDVEPE